MSVVLLVFVGIASLILVSGIYVFVIAFMRQKDVSWLVESEVRKTPFAQYFPQIAVADSWLREHKNYSITIQSHDGLNLHGLWIPADNPKGTILLAHGYRSNYLVDFGPALSQYHNMGLNMLIPDQRAHGESEGRLITFGVKESDDILGWIEYHNKTYGEYPMILSGLSMGASTVIYTLNKQLPSNVKGIIADCGFTSPAAIISAVYRRVTHLPPAPTLFITGFLAKLFADINLWGCSTVKILHKSRMPILMIHGTNDEFVPCEMTKQAYNACNSPKQILLVHEAGHGTSYLVDQHKYIETVKLFLKNTIFNAEKG